MSRCPAYSGLLLCFVAGISACARPHGASARTRVPRGSVTGRAAAAVGDSGIFASPVLPRDAHPIIPHADAESAGVAMGYWEAPAVQDRTVPYYHEIPTERRHFCGRSYYVRPVVEMPDTTAVRSNTLNDWMMWAPSWVMPICDDKGSVRSTVEFVDLPTELRVIQGPAAHDVPELVYDSATFPHISEQPSKQTRSWEGGIGMTPEMAVAAAAAPLGRTGAHVVEVPEAFVMARLLKPMPPAVRPYRTVADLSSCPRWRLTLDRPVLLRGTSSGQVVHTHIVYVSRSKADGCWGEPVVQIPKPAQPATIPFMYDASLPRPGSRVVATREFEFRWTTLRVIEPLWFEEARLAP